MSFREASSIQEPPSSSRKAGRGTGCCQTEDVVSCLMGTEKRPSLPVRKRPAVPLSHNQYELRECFPCVYNPLHFFVLDRLPFLRWLLRYNVRWLVSDIVAGLTVGPMVVPQALAYAKIANLHLRVSGKSVLSMSRFFHKFLHPIRHHTCMPGITQLLALLFKVFQEQGSLSYSESHLISYHLTVSPFLIIESANQIQNCSNVYNFTQILEQPT